MLGRIGFINIFGFSWEFGGLYIKCRVNQELNEFCKVYNLNLNQFNIYV